VGRVVSRDHEVRVRECRDTTLHLQVIQSTFKKRIRFVLLV
jgi:hypothetical protein